MVHDITKSTTVVNIKGKLKDMDYDVYIGRGSIWGNPFIIGIDGDREEVIEKYHQYFLHQPKLIAQVSKLKGQRLGCFCKPEACHGDILAYYADYGLDKGLYMSYNH
jgi:hypothetical protein